MGGIICVNHVEELKAEDTKDDIQQKMPLNADETKVKKMKRSTSHRRKHSNPKQDVKDMIQPLSQHPHNAVSRTRLSAHLSYAEPSTVLSVRSRTMRFVVSENGYSIFCDECGILSKSPPKNFFIFDEKKFVCGKCTKDVTIEGFRKPFWLLPPTAVLMNNKLSLSKYQETDPHNFEHLYFSHFFIFQGFNGMLLDVTTIRRHMEILQPYGVTEEKLQKILGENRILTELYDESYKGKYKIVSDFIKDVRQKKLIDELLTMTLEKNKITLI